MADLSGKTFGQYQLTESISSGGMATIYKAYQPALDRIVAIKVLPEYLLAQPGFLERFRIEAQAIAKLDHPHILPVYDYGEAARTPYLVMKYVPGGTLKDLMARGPLEAHQTAQLLRQIAEALDHAHQQGIVHRDVKPSNVLLQDGKWALLMDFGLAKLLTSTSNITASGTGVGTPDYISPEQAQGLAIDQRTDIYSLGIGLYQMLTGDVPFHADTPMAVMLKQIVETPSQPHLHNPNITPAVDDVILKAIAKAPADRYARATDLAGAYEMALDSGAALPTAANAAAVTLQSAPTIAQRRSPWPIVMGIALAMLAVIAVLALVLSTRSNPAPSTVQLGATLLDDFSNATIDSTRWIYNGVFTATLNSPAISIKDGRLTLDIRNPTDQYLAGGARYQAPRPFNLISTRMSLLDAAGASDVGLEVVGPGNAADSWAYIALAPSDGSIYVYTGRGNNDADETYTLLQGSGMPATHEIAAGWDGTQMTFYVDGLARKSLPAKHLGQWASLYFDVDPNSNVSGSFDDVRITYAAQ